MSSNSFPTPPQTPESEPFYAAAKEGRFLTRRCTACGEAHWYPRSICPFCFGATTWEQASGEGVVYSVSAMRRADPPYVIAYVTLTEGPTMLTNIVDCDPDAVRIGQPVVLTWTTAADGTPVPCFRPRGKSK